MSDLTKSSEPQTWPVGARQFDRLALPVKPGDVVTLRGKVHSAKPDGAIDLIESASPGPYLELFARRARFAWHYWGREALAA